MTRPAEPYLPSNTVALRHGAWSARVVEPVAEGFVEAAVATFPLLSDPSYQPALVSWARTEARIDVIERWLGEHGELDGDGVPRPALDALLKLKSAVIKERDALGLTPKSRASIGAQLAAMRRASRYDPKENPDA